MPCCDRKKNVPTLYHSAAVIFSFLMIMEYILVTSKIEVQLGHCSTANYSWISISRLWKLEPLRVNRNARPEAKWISFKFVCSIFYIIMVCWINSLELPKWGDFNECIQHTFHDKTWKFPLNKLHFWAIKNISLGLKSHDKQAIGVRGFTV